MGSSTEQLSLPQATGAIPYFRSDYVKVERLQIPPEKENINIWVLMKEREIVR